MTAATGAWLPDGHGLPDEAREAIADEGGTVHLRLTHTDSRACQGACGGGLGEWWSGRSTDVTCRACLEWVHA